MAGKGSLFSASSLSQAVLEAASHFGLEPEELAYQRVDRRHGGLRGGRRVVVEVDPESPRRQVAAVVSPEEVAAVVSPEQTALIEEASPQAAPSGDRERPAVPQAGEPLSGTDAVAYEAVQDLLELAQVRLDARVVWGEDGLDVELFGPDEEVAWRRHGELLRSLEQLLPRMLRTEGEAPACRVDCAGYWERREEELSRLAVDAAERARREGAPQLLPAMNPRERRLIHLALQEVPDVQTESEGSGFLKRIRVELSDD